MSTKDLARAAERGIEILHSYGVTGFQDAAASLQLMRALKELDVAGNLHAWVVTSMQANDFIFGTTPLGEGIIAHRAELRSEHHRPDFIKIFLDGVPPAGTAAFIEPYLSGVGFPECHCGGTTMAPAELERWLMSTAERGISAKIHCTGDASVRLVLDTVAKVRAAGHLEPKYHIAHGQFIHEQDIPRFAELDVTADISPSLWFPGVIAEAIATVLPAERASKMQPNRSLLDTGARVAGGSDWPVSVSPNAWEGIYGLVTRKDPTGQFPGTLWPEQAITLPEAISVYTTGLCRSYGRGRRHGIPGPWKVSRFHRPERQSVRNRHRGRSAHNHAADLVRRPQSLRRKAFGTRHGRIRGHWPRSEPDRFPCSNAEACGSAGIITVLPSDGGTAPLPPARKNMTMTTAVKAAPGVTRLRQRNVHLYRRFQRRPLYRPVDCPGNRRQTDPTVRFNPGPGRNALFAGTGRLQLGDSAGISVAPPDKPENSQLHFHGRRHRRKRRVRIYGRFRSPDRRQGGDQPRGRLHHRDHSDPQRKDLEPQPRVRNIRRLPVGHGRTDFGRLPGIVRRSRSRSNLLDPRRAGRVVPPRGQPDRRGSAADSVPGRSVSDQAGSNLQGSSGNGRSLAVLCRAKRCLVIHRPDLRGLRNRSFLQQPRPFPSHRGRDPVSPHGDSPRGHPPTKASTSSPAT